MTFSGSGPPGPVALGGGPDLAFLGSGPLPLFLKE